MLWSRSGVSFLVGPSRDDMQSLSDVECYPSPPEEVALYEPRPLLICWRPSCDTCGVLSVWTEFQSKMTWTNRLFLTVVAVFLLVCCVRACEPDHLVQGCRYDGRACVCGLGCDTVFRFSTRDECEKALKIGDWTEDLPDADPCRAGRCQHGGVCTHSARTPGFRCQCANTGHYGDRCHLRCPVPDEVPLQEAVQAFPSECVVI